ncbi:MAG: hypothetical protein ACQCN3_12215 [Candidatus Bathyarchaeia archaeon]|jgi:hypothetical protein
MSYELESVVLKSIDALKLQYELNENAFFTENDVICELFSIIKSNIDDAFQVHSEIRPYFVDKEKFEIRCDKNTWVQCTKNNMGDVIDVVIFGPNETYFKEAFEKTKKYSCWRLLSHPVELIKAAIEVKIRVNGNRKRVDWDINKLSLISAKNKTCLLLFLVLDRNAKASCLEQIKNECEQISLEKSIKIVCVTNKGKI